MTFIKVNSCNFLFVTLFCLICAASAGIPFFRDPDPAEIIPDPTVDPAGTDGSPGSGSEGSGSEGSGSEFGFGTQPYPASNPAGKGEGGQTPPFSDPGIYTYFIFLSVNPMFNN